MSEQLLNIPLDIITGNYWQHCA